MSSTTPGTDGETEAERYLRYAGYLWLFQGALLGLGLALFLSFGAVVPAALVGAVVLGTVLVAYGLLRASRPAWFAHMGLSLLGATSFFGLVGLYLGWKGRAAADVDIDIGDTAASVTDESPEPSAPTSSGSSPTRASTGDTADAAAAEEDQDGDDGIEYWGVDDGPRATGDWGDDS